MANATMSKEDILEAIGNMSVLELSELVEAFKSKFNVTIAAAPVGGAAPAAGGLAPSLPTEILENLMSRFGSCRHLSKVSARARGQCDQATC